MNVEEFLIDTQCVWSRTGHQQIKAFEISSDAFDQLLRELGKRVEIEAEFGEHRVVRLQGPSGPFIVRDDAK